ncbi:type II secretion system F family protein [Aeoliella sp. ICT_H6.2]|uniref:Type II secretion system F family protein n=1 Tax=Aeoliella straminimaris TaxID=2954799 RepID=A0A9X2F9Z4_9BACT|nr:type II secretion system F family protein [Aeoliella straminimaris]MCO6045030.1 type II secretion system F family protein [Aeoliella straminimaris]
MSEIALQPTTLDDLAALNAELAALAGARIPLEPELRRLANQLPPGAGALSLRLAQRIEQGNSLASALDAEGGNLPEVYHAVVEAGLASGDPTAALEEMTRSTRRLASLQRVTSVALLVPITVIILASLLLALLLYVVFRNIAWIAPKVLQPYADLAGQSWLIAALTVVVPVLAIVIPLVWWWRSRRATSLASPRWWLLGWIPGARRLHRLSSSATMAEVLRMTTVAGLPLDRSLRIAAGAVGHRGYRRAALELADQAATGQPLADSPGHQQRSPLERFPPLVKVALEQSGRRQLMAASLDRAARSYQMRADLLQTSLNDFVPAMLTVGVAGTVVAVYCIGMMWPYTRMLHTLADSLWR